MPSKMTSVGNQPDIIATNHNHQHSLQSPPVNLTSASQQTSASQLVEISQSSQAVSNNESPSSLSPVSLLRPSPSVAGNNRDDYSDMMADGIPAVVSQDEKDTCLSADNSVEEASSSSSSEVVGDKRKRPCDDDATDHIPLTLAAVSSPLASPNQLGKTTKTTARASTVLQAPPPSAGTPPRIRRSPRLERRRHSLAVLPASGSRPNAAWPAFSLQLASEKSLSSAGKPKEKTKTATRPRPPLAPRIPTSVRTTSAPAVAATSAHNAIASAAPPSPQVLNRSQSANSAEVTASNEPTTTIDSPPMGTSSESLSSPLAPPTSALKSLIAKTPLKEDGTPFKPRATPRPVYDDDDETSLPKHDSPEDPLLKVLGTGNGNLDSPVSSPIVQPQFTETTAGPKSTTSTQPISLPAPTTNITPYQLYTRMILVFPALKTKRLSNLTCVAPRLFAAFTLYLEAHTADTKGTGKHEEFPNAAQAPPPRKRSRRQATRKISSIDDDIPSMGQVKSILPLLTRLVELEVTLLQDSQGKQSPTKKGRSSRTSRQHRRRVHFAAFDGSALKPPSDVLEDSHAHQQGAIDGLAQVVGTVDELIESELQQRLKGRGQEHSCSEVLRKLAEYLRDPLRQGDAAVCAESLSDGRARPSYPVERVLKAAGLYADDFDRIHNFLNAEEDANQEQATSLLERKSSLNLSWHHRMADASAQLVRYWLRTELNPVPERAPSEKHTETWNCRVCELVSLELNEGDDIACDTAIDDGSLSSLVSNAASHIYHYFGVDWKDWKERLASTPKEFLTSNLSQKGIAPSETRRRRSGPTLRRWSDEDWNLVEQELEVATGFLAAANGANFLYELLTIVLEHPDYAKSWQRTIELSASQLDRCAQGSLQREDEHLRLLKMSPQILLQQLPAIIDWSRKNACQEALKELTKRFLFGKKDAKKTRRKRAYQPQVGHLEQFYEQAISKTFFPSVELADDEDSDNDSDS